MDVEPKREIVIEPITEPIPGAQPAPAPVVPAYQPEPAPSEPAHSEPAPAPEREPMPV